MIKDIVIYGAGGKREVACLLRLINEKEKTWNLLGFVDDLIPIICVDLHGKKDRSRMR